MLYLELWGAYLELWQTTWSIIRSIIQLKELGNNILHTQF